VDLRPAGVVDDRTHLESGRLDRDGGREDEVRRIACPTARSSTPTCLPDRGAGLSSH
jgi:hypothetical protein